MRDEEIELVQELDDYLFDKLSKKELSRFLAGYIHFSQFGNLERKKKIVDGYIKEVLDK